MQIIGDRQPRRKYAEYLTRTGENTEAFPASPRIHFTAVARYVFFGVHAFLRPSCLVERAEGHLGNGRRHLAYRNLFSKLVTTLQLHEVVRDWFVEKVCLYGVLRRQFDSLPILSQRQ